MNGLSSYLPLGQVGARVASTRFLRRGLLGCSCGSWRPPVCCLPGDPRSTRDGASVGVPKHQVFPKNSGLLSYYRSSSGDTAILAPGGPPNNHEMGDPMTRTMAVADTTKYSEYPALRGVPGGFRGQKFSAERAVSCTALKYRQVVRRSVPADAAPPAPPRHPQVEQ